MSLHLTEVSLHLTVSPHLKSDWNLTPSVSHLTGISLPVSPLETYDILNLPIQHGCMARRTLMMLQEILRFI